EEVGHVHDVVDDLPAVGPLDRDRVPRPVAPLTGEDALDPGDRDLVGRWVALRVVPDEQLSVLLERAPRARAGAEGDALGVGDRRALAGAVPPPVVERAGDLVALDLALGEVSSHVAAVAVEHVQRAVGAAEHHEFGTERVDRVRLAVGEVLHEAEAVPPAGEPFRGSADVDRADRACLRHDEPPVPRATVPVNPSVPGNPRPVTGSMCVVVDNGRLRTPQTRTCSSSTVRALVGTRWPCSGPPRAGELCPRGYPVVVAPRRPGRVASA